MANPFFIAYAEADLLGRMIFLALYASSVVCWSLLIYKARLFSKVRRASHQFYLDFQRQKGVLLQVEYKGEGNPLFRLFSALKQQTVELLGKNQHFSKGKERYLTSSDMEVVAERLQSSIGSETLSLEQYLFLLATIVGLAPLLGLLGTVWGILTTFSTMQVQTAGSVNQLMLGGLSLALTTTVLGLLNAIPALIGYNLFKSQIRQFVVQMESFASESLIAVELQYKKIH